MFLDEQASVGIVAEVSNVEAEATYIENYHEAMVAAVAENEYNFNAIMRPVAVAELAAVKEGKAPRSVWTEGALSSFWEKVKKFFLKVLAKIKGVFASFMSRIDQHFRSGKSFFDKYKKELADKFAKIDKDKVKFMGYEFTAATHTPNSKITDGLMKIKFANLSAAEADAIVADRDKQDEVIEAARGDLIGKGSLTASEFSKELFEHFRGSDTKEELTNVSFQTVASVLGNDKAKKAIQDSYKGLEKAVNRFVSDCDRAKNSAINVQVGSETGDKDEAKSRTAAYPILVSSVKDLLAVAQTYVGAQMKAVQDEISQAKAFAGQVLRSAKHEGTSFEEGTVVDGDIFGGVKLR